MGKRKDRVPHVIYYDSKTLSKLFNHGKRVVVHCFYVGEVQTILIGDESHNIFRPHNHLVSSYQERFKAKSDKMDPGAIGIRHRD